MNYEWVEFKRKFFPKKEVKLLEKNKKASLREAHERTETMENRKKDSG